MERLHSIKCYLSPIYCRSCRFQCCSIDQRLQNGIERFSIEDRVISLWTDIRTTLEHYIERSHRKTSSNIWGSYGCRLPSAEHTKNLPRSSRSKPVGFEGLDRTGIETRRLRGNLCREPLRVCGSLPGCRRHWMSGRGIERWLHPDRATRCHLV